MNVTVLGSSGQLGQCFQEIARNQKTVQYHFLDSSQFDIGDPASYENLDPDRTELVINCAAYTQVDKAETEREKAYGVNTAGPGLLAEFGANHHIPLIHFSTDYIFGPASVPIAESFPVEPVNYYGWTKWEGEETIRRSGVAHLIIRTSWLYSQFGHNFVKTMIRLAGLHSQIRVVDDQMGSPTYAVDLASAVDQILSRSEDVTSIPWGTYHFANQGSVTWYEFAREILKDRDVEVVPIPSSAYPTPAARPRYSVLDSTKFRETFSFPIPGWKESLELCIAKIVEV